MTVGVLKIELFISQSSSLKEKRMVLRSIKDRIKNKFNVSIAEVDAHDKWQRATLGIACVGSDKKYVDGVFCAIRDLLDGCHAAELIASEMELI
ncbi:MAG: DUF503 domain-containing protein [Candidatus Omnitrophota bacterium]